jgi:hypothetical protein
VVETNDLPRGLSATDQARVSRPLVGFEWNGRLTAGYDSSAGLESVSADVVIDQIDQIDGASEAILANDEWVRAGRV